MSYISVFVSLHCVQPLLSTAATNSTASEKAEVGTTISRGKLNLSTYHGFSLPVFPKCCVCEDLQDQKWTSSKWKISNSLSRHFKFKKKNIPTTAIHVGTRWGCDSRKLLENLRRHGHHLLPKPTREADSETGAIEETAWPFLLQLRPQWEAGSNFIQNQHAPKVRKCI